MEKFTKWSSEHDAHIANAMAHKKARMDKRNQPVVRKVEAAPVATAVPATEETKTEE